MLTPMPPNCTRRALGRNVAQILRVELTTGNHGLPRKERYGYNLSCFFFFFHFSCSARMQQKSSWASLGPSQLDSSLLNNIQKLFSERIDLSGPVEANKVSIVMAIIKTCLKVVTFFQ